MELHHHLGGGLVKRLGVHRDIILLALGLTLLRLLAAAGIHLTEDEAYYRLWAAQLHLGYYDHPPMIAWWIGCGISLVGDSALGVRLLPTLATGVATWLVSDLARQLGAQPATQLKAAFWYNATLTVGVGGMLATPDAPATFFWVLTIWALARTAGERSGLWWAAAGVTAGLATISKYSSLFLAPGALLWLCLSPGGMAKLKTPWPWVAAGLAGTIFATNVGWNAQNDWITFGKQSGRVAPSSFSPTHVIELLVTQFILLTPMISLYALKGAREAWILRDKPEAIQLLLPVATTVPFAAYLVLHSLHDRVQGHWPVPIFAALVVCAVVAADRLPVGVVVRRLQALAEPSVSGSRSPPSVIWPPQTTSSSELLIRCDPCGAGRSSPGRSRRPGARSGPPGSAPSATAPSPSSRRRDRHRSRCCRSMSGRAIRDCRLPARTSAARV